MAWKVVVLVVAAITLVMIISAWANLGKNILR
jgi:hypothetical protein